MLKLLTLLVTIIIFAMIVKKKLDPKIAFLTGGVFILGTCNKLDILFDVLLKTQALIFPTVVIILSFGFAEVLKKEKYILSTVNLFTRFLIGRRSKIIMVFIAIISIWLGSLAFMSANASCGVVAPILFPIFLRLGLNPELIATSFIAGAWGSIVHPGDINANIIYTTLTSKCQLNDEQVANITAKHITPALVGLLVIALAIYLLNKSSLQAKNNHTASIEESTERVTLRSIIAFIPIILLGVYAIIPNNFHVISSKIMVPIALLTGTIFSIFMVKNISKRTSIIEFGKGGIKGIKDVILLIIASNVFIAGFSEGIGNDAIANWLGNLGSIKVIAAIVITFIFAVLTGSGDAIVTSIVQVFAPLLNTDNASVAASSIWFAGEMGRCASPVSAATITVAKISSSTPARIIKRNALPVVCGLLCAIIVLYSFEY